MDGRLAHVELLGDLVLGSTASDGGDDGSTASGFPVTLLMATSGRGCGFSVQDYTGADRDHGGTKLIGMRWHLAD